MIEPDESRGEAAEGPRPSALERIRTGAVLLGTLAILFSAALWVAEYAGYATEIPYVLIGIAGLVVYNLARLPVYLRYFFPREDAPGPKFHRRD